MNPKRKNPALRGVLLFALVFALGAYFTFASVQGDYGLFRRVQIDAEAQNLAAQVAALEVEVAEFRNKTRRLSDDFLDLDLLDEQARDVLGLVRSDEVIIR